MCVCVNLCVSVQIRIDMEVEDNGDGIPPHLINRLFKPFSEGIPLIFVLCECVFALIIAH